ncbi:phytanoyl-CoA dioxygenase family protein [Candidatus Poribacteria bacterium]|nr:phytanoyl-CoA dioxygenase family protein [Candidatus Poribacteria bacterium]
MMTLNTPKKIPAGTSFEFGEHRFHFGAEIVELVDSSSLLNDPNALHRKMREDGYLFIRGFHPRKDAERAAYWTLQAIAQNGGLKPDTPVEEGIIVEANKKISFFRNTQGSHAKPILDVVDSERTMRFYEEFLGGTVITFDKRWLRCMAKGGHNHFHYDSVYVGRGTQNRYTMWSALTDIGLENGPLVICLGSHRHNRLKSTYGATDMDRDLTEAVFSTDPREMVEKLGFTLATAHFEPGDVIIFGLYMMHSSAPNRSDRYRISIDTRYQLACEEKDDRFFFREDGSWLGNFYNKGASYRPIGELRREWELE